MHILITGAASGIGQATARYFLDRGHIVYGIDIVPLAGAEHFHTFAGDITDEASLLKISETLQKQHIVLDAILNIAGIHKMASLVESNFADMKQVVDINLTGTMLVNRMFHQFLQPKGRIVIVTSEVAGFDPMPFNGLYSVTKTALDAYAQALRQELNLIGQTVVTVRPGAVETKLSVGSVQATRDLAASTVLYRQQAKSFSGLAARFMGKPIPPERLAALLYRATTAKHPKLIYHKHRNIGLVLLSCLSKRWQCNIIRFLLRLNLF